MPATGTDKAESRRIKRIAITLPIRVDGKSDGKTDWNELVRTTNVSMFGAGFVLPRKVERGRLLQLTLPMPQRMRTFDFTDTQYKVWGVVTESKPATDNPQGEFIIGVAFIGKYPPSSYIENPAQTYDFVIGLDGKADKISPANGVTPVAPQTIKQQHKIAERRDSRYDIPVDMVIKVLDSNGKLAETEFTVAGNISPGGAAIFSSLNLDIGSKLQVRSKQYKVDLKAMVRGRSTGSDGIPRLHIEFLDGMFPLVGIDRAF